jgi:hypothetical protein
MDVVALGRYGDVANALPIAYELSRQGELPRFFISKEFASILDGVTYVQPMVVSLDYKEVRKVLRPETICCQSYKHPDTRRLTDSYQKEAWRIAGWLGHFGEIPLVFDNRNLEREAALIQKYNVNEETILVAGKGCSSPFRFDLWDAMKGAGNIVNLSDVKAERIFDIIGLIEKACLLLTIDSAPLHLARATNTPVVALINDGWYGSVPPKKGVAIRYSDATAQNIAEAIVKCLESSTS